MHALIRYWQIDGIMAIFLIVLLFGYLYLTGFKIVKKSIYFFIGFGLILISVASPMHFLGENYLMSVHMGTHVILLLIAAPMLVMGIPKKNLNSSLFVFSKKLYSNPWIPWIAGVCIMWFWHIPVIFNHLFEKSIPGTYHLYSINILSDIHLISLVLCGIFFSWPVIGPVPSLRMAPLNAVLYLSAACVFCSVLGLLITFAPMGIYTHYMHIEDHFGFLNTIRNEEGISAAVDQQAGGLIMWVPGCLIYLTASMYLLMRWFNEKPRKPSLISQNKEL